MRWKVLYSVDLFNRILDRNPVIRYNQWNRVGAVEPRVHIVEGRQPILLLPSYDRCASRPRASSPDSGLRRRTSRPNPSYPNPRFRFDVRPELVALSLIHPQVTEHEVIEPLHLGAS